jgi:hypothetical protein
MTRRKDEKMENCKNTIDFSNLTEEDLNQIAGGRWGPFGDIPDDLDENEVQTCPKCGGSAPLYMFSWGQNGPDGTYHHNAYIKKFRCRSCFYWWEQGVVITGGDADR